MPTAEIIAIGTELLLGEIQDTNTRYMARFLRDMGVDLFRTTIVGDNIGRVAQAIKEIMERAQIVITTGGLGPTVDDPTREAVAKAVNVELEYKDELWEQIVNRFKRFGRTPTENNRKQAFVPKGSILVENAVGTAPSFIFDNGASIVASLPGVPREMEYLLENAIAPYLRRRFNLLGIIKTYVIHTSGIGESQIDEWIGDYEKWPNPTVGLVAHVGQVDIRITAKADSNDEADEMIKRMADEILARCGDAVFGAEEETLESLVLEKLSPYYDRLMIIEYGLDGHLIKVLERLKLGKDQIIERKDPVNEQEMKFVLGRYASNGKNTTAIGVCLDISEDKSMFNMIILHNNEFKSFSRSYGGSPKNASAWAINMALDIIRRNF